MQKNVVFNLYLTITSKVQKKKKKSNFIGYYSVEEKVLEFESETLNSGSFSWPQETSSQNLSFLLGTMRKQDLDEIRAAFQKAWHDMKQHVQQAGREEWSGHKRKALAGLHLHRILGEWAVPLDEVSR